MTVFNWNLAVAGMTHRRQSRVGYTGPGWHPATLERLTQRPPMVVVVSRGATRFRFAVAAIKVADNKFVFFDRPLVSLRDKREKHVALSSTGAYVDRSWRNIHDHRPFVSNRGSNPGSNGPRFSHLDEPQQCQLAGHATIDLTLEQRAQKVEVMGIEPTTSSMRPRRSAGLSYTPKGGEMRIVGVVRLAARPFRWHPASRFGAPSSSRRRGCVRGRRATHRACAAVPR